MKVLKSKRGEMAITISIIVLVSMLVVALAMRVYPVFMAKQQLDTYASELCREAELSGRVGIETTDKIQRLSAQTGLNPAISWSQTGKIQLDGEITVTCSVVQNIGFARFGSFPITLTGSASGRSEVYWK
jgi:hypothetical protein